MLTRALLYRWGECSDQVRKHPGISPNNRATELRDFKEDEEEWIVVQSATESNEDCQESLSPKERWWSNLQKVAQHNKFKRDA